VAYCVRAQSTESETIALGLAALAAFEGAAGIVTLEQTHQGTVTACWEGGTAKFDPVALELSDPGVPQALTSQPTSFLTALHEAGRTTARDLSRYALTRIQLKGRTGQISGSDGKQALVLGGFTFPFHDDLLVPAIPVFGTKELLTHAELGIGVADDWLYVTAGPWHIWLQRDGEGRFPDIAAAVPRAVTNRVTIADADAAKLIAVLAHLPGAGSADSPLTLDLSGQVTVRMRSDDGAPVTEVALPDSASSGAPTRIVLSGAHLGRALMLGFRELQFAGPERPITARDHDRLYLSATLDPASAIAPESAPANPQPVRRTLVRNRQNPLPDANGHADANGVSDPLPTGELIDPLVEAEGLRAALTEAAARATRLVTSLKQFRRERRALVSAWSSLKQLNLGP
jgi:hypothetical protein